MKLNQVLTFPTFYSSIKDQKMSVTLAYKLDKLAEQVEKEIALYQKQFQHIIQEYCVFNNDGTVQTTDDNAFKIRSGAEQECAEAFNELQELEVDLVPCIELEELSQLVLSPAEIRQIRCFIKEL